VIFLYIIFSDIFSSVCAQKTHVQCRGAVQGNEEGCVFSDRVHFQMISLLSAQKDFKALEALVDELIHDPSIDKRELYKPWHPELLTR
jgi:hypothetical protein